LPTLTQNILKPYKWYEVNSVVIPSDDYKTIKKSNLRELWILRLGFVLMIIFVLVCMAVFAAYYSKKSETAEYETTKQNVVNGVKFFLTLWIGSLMYACNATTNARDSILTNHLKTAVDVVRRVERERWCKYSEPIALKHVPREAERRRSQDLPATA
jgi:hypothetical protein